MKSFRIFASTPVRLFDPAIAIAASRAGEVGVLDLEHLHDEAASRRAIARLARHASGCGIRLDNESSHFFNSIVEDLPEQVDTVILIPSDVDSLPAQVERLHEIGRNVLLQVTATEHVTLAAASGVDGVIAKGSEAGGWAGAETSFILLQRLVSTSELPVFAHGGIGLRTASAAYAAGAAGIVLDSQLLLLRESTIPEDVRTSISRMDGSETRRFELEDDLSCRVYSRPHLGSVEALAQELLTLQQDDRPAGERRAEQRRIIGDRIGWSSNGRDVWPIGEDAALAAELAQRFVTVGGTLKAIRDAVDKHRRLAPEVQPLSESGSMARAHGTRYPVLQGPMTRVSDNAEFALRVAEGGALPFLALALLRGPEVEKLLEETRTLLGDRPWGVGILGFVPLELREEQLEVIRRHKPPFALIAGGRPDQAQALEKEGIATYLHAPSPELLRLFLQQGARRFVFEGQECGGHVGPRSSFVLWDAALAVLEEELPEGEEASCHIAFAGGIHDGVSSSMVATMVAPLAARGVHAGVLLGTSYLFTEEAVATGAIREGFQRHAVDCRRTVLVDSGPGHAVRIVDTPYAAEFHTLKQRLLKEGRSAEDIRLALEELNLGRLRIASKGISRNPKFGENPDVPKYIDVDDEAQHRDGMYMIGQLAALRDGTCTIEELHQEIVGGGCRRVAALADSGEPLVVEHRKARLAQVAIVGMSAILPKADTVREYWENILDKTSGLTEIPRERWDWERYFDPDPNARDKIYSKWGGFISEQPFDPVEFGMPPNSILSIDPMQLLALKAAREALEDSGYLQREFDRSRTSVILGASGGTGDLGASYLLRSSLPLVLGDDAAHVIETTGNLPEWTEDSFAGLLLNVAAGRIANRFDFGGVNYVVDAACASSLTAVHLAVRELEIGSSDMVLVGGVDATQNPFGYLCFSKTHALSPSGRANTFDADADGIVISEGIVMLVLKRLADAERDGDRVYAVIQATAGSSDGRSKGMTAPRPEGQMRALLRAYEMSGISPATVELFEAHGTGTAVGDRSEAEAVSRILESSGAGPSTAAIGSVKSLIGHTKATAGVAGLAKMALALYHEILPPTVGVTRPNEKVRPGDGPLYVNSEARPWLGSPDRPRRAAVNAFGFGGTNFHAVLEEYDSGFLPREAPSRRWPSELFLWEAASPEDLAESLKALSGFLTKGASPRMSDLAFSLWHRSREYRRSASQTGARLAIVASSLDDLKLKLTQAIERVKVADDGLSTKGIYLSLDPAPPGKTAFVFPGQGSQYPNMVRDLALHFPDVRRTFERFDETLIGRFPERLSSFVFPPPSFSPQDEKRHRERLTQTNVAQPALGAASMALDRLLATLGVEPDLVAGHSYGEYTALCAASVFGLETLAELSEARGRSIIEAAEADLGTMAAVTATRDRVAQAVDGLDEVWIANLNAPEQTIISGTRSGIGEAIERLENLGLTARAVPVACAFHSPLVAPARERLATLLENVAWSSPEIDVYSNTTAQAYSQNPDEIARQLADHLVEPVHFSDEILAMYEAGARIFLEVGPKTVLTGLVQQILADRPHTAIAVDASERHGLVQLQNALAALVVRGVPVVLDRLYENRGVRELDLDRLDAETRKPTLSPTTWMIDGGGARPAGQPRRQKSVASRPTASPGANPRETKVQRTVQAGVEPKISQPGTSDPPRDATRSEPALSRNEGEAARAMVKYHQLMEQFLETERRVMHAYLTGRPEAGASAQERGDSVSASPLAVPGLERTLSDSALPAVEAAPEASAQATAPPTPEPSAGSKEISEPDPGRPPDAAQITERLLEIVSDRTGYPAEMLDLDVDIEADLGIDSIKRVEILGSVQKACLPDDLDIPGNAMEQLTAAKTLRGIVTWLEAAIADAMTTDSSAAETIEGDSASQPPAPPAEPAPEPDFDTSASPAETKLETGESDVSIPRSVMTLRPAPLTMRSELELAPGRILLVTDDGRGIAQRLAEDVRQLGVDVVLIQHDTTGQRPLEEDPGRVDLADPDAVDRLVSEIRERRGPVAGVVHLTPLAAGFESPAAGLEEWRSRGAAVVKGLFYLAQAAAPDLQEAARSGGAIVAAATPLAPAFAIDSDEEADFDPLHAGIAGLLKTLALELEGVRCRAVAMERGSAVSTAADRILAELMASSSPTEIVYRDGVRSTLEPVLASLAADAPGEKLLGPEHVVLVTGGARGITAEVACHLAERYQPTLLLVGRSPLPSAQESPATAGLTSPREIKEALIEEQKQRGVEVSLPKIEKSYRRLLMDREMRGYLERMQNAGSDVEYFQVDVRDERAMKKLLDETYASRGRLDGVVHGAGIIEDKLLAEKTPSSFDRVFDTKADSAFLLSTLVRPKSLRFMALFGSVSGTFGNRGQADYAAANEVLSKLATRLDRSWPGRVVCISWGPWLSGMVSDELQREFARRGVKLIPVDEGCRLLDHELRLGRKGEAEVVRASGALRPAAAAGREPELPLSRRARLSRNGNRTVEAAYPLDPSFDIYLRDHQLDAKPVMPMAMAMELMAEVSQQAWPDLEIAGLRELRVLKGLVVDDGPREIRVVASCEDSASGEFDGLEVDVELFDSRERELPCYRATIELARRLPDSPADWRRSTETMKPFPMSVDDAYREWLFHGPVFQGIKSLAGLGDRSIEAVLEGSTPNECLAGPTGGSWLIDPVIFDSGLQLFLLWARAHLDKTPLPSRFRRYRRFAAARSEQIRCHVEILESSRDPVYHIDVGFVGSDGRLVGLLEEMEGACSRSLNRLAAEAKRNVSASMGQGS